MPHLDLPEPWVRGENLTLEESDMLEKSIGSGLTYDDLDDEDVTREGAATFPRSPKAWAVMGRRWVVINNRDTGEEVLLRLQHDAEGNVTVTSVAVPYDGGRTLTGADLRDIPVAALAAVFTADEMRGHAAMMRALALMGNDALPDPLAALPEGGQSQEFLALVARQYEALEGQHGPATSEAMAKLNGRPASTVRRWIAQARKAKLLPPAMPGRRK